MSVNNYVFLHGHLGNDPEVKSKEKGKELCTFSFATKYRKKNEGGKTEYLTEWHNCVCFGGSARLVGDHLKKGSHVLLTGSLRTRNYEDKQGVVRYVTEVIVSDVEFLNAKPQ